jgi:uncharacterized phage protein gp47/JayE
MTVTSPIDYTNKDFDSFRAAMLDYASRTFPEWTQASEGDFGVLLVELFAYCADILSYYGDRVANEAFLSTATQRRSVLNIADLLAYVPSGALASVGTVTFVNFNAVDTIVPAGTRVSTDFVESLDSAIVFETVTNTTVPANNGTAVINVAQGETISDEIAGVSDGTSNQFFKLSRVPVLDGTVFVEVGDDVLGYDTWTYVQHLIDAGPSDPNFTSWVDDANSYYVRFGDNIDGAIPAIGANIRVTYRIGGGAFGNLNAKQITTIVDSIDGIGISQDATNTPISSAMTGGADAESLDQIRVNAPRSFRTQNRLVTIQDFKDAALGVAAVIKTNAIANTFTNVSVFIIGPGGTTNTALINATYSYLTQPIRKLAGATVNVSAGVLIPVNVSLSLGVLNKYDRTQVKNAVVQAIQGVLSLDNQDLGGRVSSSGIYKAIASVPGVDYAILSNLARNDAAQGVVTDIVFREFEIASPGTITITTTVGGF